MATVTITIDDKVFTRLGAMAQERGMSRTAFSKVLFEAAYSARCGTCPDQDLNASVAGALILQGSKMDTAAIAAVLRCSEAVVVRIQAAWRKARPA